MTIMIHTSKDQQIVIAGEAFILLPERAVFWPERDTVIVTDLHLGKPAPARTAAGPEDTTPADLARLARVLERTAAGRLLILGDLLHARSGSRVEAVAEFARWRVSRAALEITLIRGNHDRLAGDPPETWRIRCVDEPLLLAPFAFCHYPPAENAAYAVAGHLHPAVVLAGPGRQRLRFPCFWFGPEQAVLPSFNENASASVIRPQPGDRVFVLSGDAVLAVQR